MTEYYCLVAGLVDYGFDADRKSLNYTALMEEIMNTVTKKDRAKIELLMGYYDIQNIINVAAGKTDRYTSLGSVSLEDVKRVSSYLTKAEAISEDDDKMELPQFIEIALKAILSREWAEENGVDTEQSLEQLLYKLYYEYIAKRDKGFVREWSETERNIRNITAAFKAKTLGVSPEKYLIGGGVVVENLTTNSAADFGLKAEIPYIDELISILSGDNILKKERDIDMMKLSIIESMNTFNYFNINVILGYFLKVAMIERWLALDPKVGHDIFERIVKNLSTMDFTEKIAE